MNAWNFTQHNFLSKILNLWCFRIIKLKPGVLNTSAAHQMYFRGKLSRKFGQNSSQNIRSGATILWRWDLNRLAAPRLHHFADVFPKKIPKNLNKSYFVRTIQLPTVKEAAWRKAFCLQVILWKVLVKSSDLLMTINLTG